MKTFKTRIELIDFLESSKPNFPKIGFVATMGALHEGHLSLIAASKAENQLTICSIFVNPTQFNDPADLQKYPRPIENDLHLLQLAGCDVAFLPDITEMYLHNEQWTHSFEPLENIWEGAMRPGHFKGVGQIVYKLFELIKPTNAYFGQKDFQQTLIVKKLVKDFSLAINVVVCPILREKGGLAMSSRNSRLTEQERINANEIFQILSNCKQQFLKHTPIMEIKLAAIASLEKIPNGILEYFELVDQVEMRPIEDIQKATTAIAIVAIRFNGTRLLDNLILV